MPHEYYPMFVLAALTVGLVAIVMVLPRMLAPRRDIPAKYVPYESGIQPVGAARGRFNVRFQMIAMSFIIFDIEIVFFYPWAVNLRELGLYGLLGILIFTAVLIVGYAYEWRRGAFRWD